MTWGIKISKVGYDVLTCTTQQLVMSSEFNMLKTKMTGVTSTNVAHGLAYTPIFFSCQIIDATTSAIVWQNGWDCPYMDATNFIPSAETKYYIFYQQGA